MPSSSCSSTSQSGDEDDADGISMAVNEGSTMGETAGFKAFHQALLLLARTTDFGCLVHDHSPCKKE